LLLMRLPVRCLNCGERTFTSVSQFLKLRRMRKARHREHQHRSTM
jgi:DNA-directed RNA polymerase subunit N (RpoN/RPB10)